MIKILMVHWGFIPGGGVTHAKYLQKVSDFGPFIFKNVCISSPRWAFDEPSASSLQLERISIRNRLDPTWIFALRKIMKKEKPDLVLTIGVNGVFASLIAGFGLRIPIVSIWHGEYIPTGLAQKMRKPVIEAMETLLFRFVVREIATVSNFSRRRLQRKKIPADKIAVIHNGVPDWEEVSMPNEPADNKMRIHDKLLVGTAGRLVKGKGLEWFLTAVSQLKGTEYLYRIHFVIFGDGPLRQSLACMVQELGIQENVTFAGHKNNLCSWFRSLDIFILPSSLENFSITLLEAMKMGLPIIATDVGGNSEAISDKIEGLLVPYGESDRLLAAIKNLADDPDLRRRLGNNARQKYLTHFTLETMLRKTSEWLLYCAKQHRRN